MTVFESLCWPRLNSSDAEALYLGLSLEQFPPVDSSLIRVEFAPVGQRVTQERVDRLREELVLVASEYGFNRRRGYDQDQPENPEETFRQFDRAMYWKFRNLVPMSEAAAGSASVWNWFALKLLPDVTYWRWVFVKSGQGWDKERWIGTDLTRHTWGRQWWRSYRFKENPGLIERLNEKELVQLLERKDTIAASPRLLCALAEKYADARDSNDFPREKFVIEVAKRILREQAFINPLIFDDEEMGQWIEYQINAAVFSLKRDVKSQISVSTI